jgi:hypothetical protein
MLNNRTRLVGQARCYLLNVADLLHRYQLVVELMAFAIVSGKFTTQGSR